MRGSGAGEVEEGLTKMATEEGVWWRKQYLRVRVVEAPVRADAAEPF